MNPRARLGLFAAFAGLGGTAATVPALVPSLEERFGQTALSAIPALFTGLLLGVLLSALLLARVRARTVAASGAGIQAVAVLALPFSISAGTVLIVAAVAGIGFGLTEAAGSVAAKRATSGSATRVLSALTGAVAVTAAVSPILLALLPGGVWLVPALVAALQLVACLALVGGQERVQDPDGAIAADATSTARSSGSARTLAIAAVALVLYVGVETVFSGWSAVIPATVLGVDATTAALGTSAFWVCMAAGRFLASALLHRGLRPAALLAICTGAAASALLVTAFFTSSPFALLGLALAIVAMAPVYSLVLGEALDRLAPAAAARAAGPLVAFGALGGTLIPAALLLLGLQPASAGTFIVSAAVGLALCLGALVVLRSSRTPGAVAR